MNVVDASAWLEYFANGPNASFFSTPIQQVEDLLVPSLTIYEVFKRILHQRDEGHALQVVAAMQLACWASSDHKRAENIQRKEGRAVCFGLSGAPSAHAQRDSA